ncbi:MAG: hemerythrin domain-containing protein [Cyclobacteriaceae bacterium]
MAEDVKRKIADIVGENYVFGAVLYYFGIEFYNYSQKTLFQACEERGLDAGKVMHQLESVGNASLQEKVSLQNYPIELIIEYLKHTHHIFVKERLPYLATLIENFPSNEGVGEDLKMVFPLFVEDFIHHIYQEEDTLFTYVKALQNFLQGKGNVSQVYYLMEKHSLQRYAMEHSEHDDEMKGIRQLTGDYYIPEGATLHLKVIMSELKLLEEQLITHAGIENDILFPKALMMEHRARKDFSEKIGLN